MCIRDRRTAQHPDAIALHAAALHLADGTGRTVRGRGQQVHEAVHDMTDVYKRQVMPKALPPITESMMYPACEIDEKARNRLRFLCRMRCV